MGKMKWQKSIREDGRIEYICEHGVGHSNDIHGCDSCCDRGDFPGNTTEIPGLKEYRISRDGRIWTEKQDKWMKTHEKNGYLFIQLRKNNTHTYTSVHRLVAITYIPNPENKRCVNHKDFNTKNNHVDNLEWVTDKENVMYSYNHYRRPHKAIIAKKNGMGARRLTDEQVLEIRKSGDKYHILAKKYNVHRETIGRARRRVTYKMLS